MLSWKAKASDHYTTGLCPAIHILVSFLLTISCIATPVVQRWVKSVHATTLVIFLMIFLLIVLTSEFRVIIELHFILVSTSRVFMPRGKKEILDIFGRQFWRRQL